MIVIIDNYDSFSYNLYQYVGEINNNIKVIRNDEMTADEVINLMPSHIIISPGPGFPSAAGIIEELILKAAGKLPVLGVCLGHQAIAEAFGAEIIHSKRLMHGKKDLIYVANGNPIFSGLSPVIEAARYHSLSVSKENLPDELLVIAEDRDGEIMGIKYRDYDIYGIQFHPESILTSCGEIIIRNFLSVGGDNNDF